MKQKWEMTCLIKSEMFRNGDDDNDNDKIRLSDGQWLKVDAYSHSQETKACR